MNHLLAEYAMCDHFTWWGQDSAKGQWTVALGNLLVSVSLGSDLTVLLLLQWIAVSLSLHCTYYTECSCYCSAR